MGIVFSEIVTSDDDILFPDRIPSPRLPLWMDMGGFAPLQTPRGDYVPPQPPIHMEDVEGGQSLLG
jgi:hypothetical protein